MQHAYPHSMASTVDQPAVRAMLKGSDAVVLHVLSALGVPATVVRVWEEVGEEARPGAVLCLCCAAPVPCCAAVLCCACAVLCLYRAVRSPTRFPPALWLLSSAAAAAAAARGAAHPPHSTDAQEAYGIEYYREWETEEELLRAQGSLYVSPIPSE